MKAEYRIVIGQKRDGSGPLPHAPRSKLDLIKAWLLALLLLSAVVGLFLAAFVLGSIIATALVILAAVGIVVWSVRRLFLKFKRGTTNSWPS